MKQQYKVIEEFNNNKPDITEIIKEIFRNYIKEELNLINDLNYKK